ncbi:MAG: glycoside hydrolase family 78 protein, partial [Planctomycetota bacterium]
MKQLVKVLLAGMMLVFGSCVVEENSGITAKELRCEYCINPLGIDVVKPRLGWILQSSERGQQQTAYQVLVASSEEKLKADEGDLWDSGKVESNQSIHVVYKGKPLTSGMRCCWKVRVWDKNGKTSVWSEPATFEMGLLKPSDWEGCWTSANWHGDWHKGQAPPLPWLRKRFVLESTPKRARAYVSAMGYYELYINGRKVDDHVLIPAVCDYS